MSKRKKYSPEFKREAVELARRSGASCRQIAQEIGVAPSLLIAGFERHSQAQKRLFPEQVAREMRSWPASSVS